LLHCCDTFQNKKAAKHESIVIAARPSLFPLRILRSQTLKKIQLLTGYHNHPVLSIKKTSFTDFDPFRCVLPMCMGLSPCKTAGPLGVMKIIKKLVLN
jgi:hypothetical protein